MRARDLGIDLPGTPGPHNAITDVPGVLVGTVTRIEDTDDAAVAARTGVTAILPLGRDGVGSTVPAGLHSLNGNGELTGSHWIRDSGSFAGPVMLTNTHAVGTVHRGTIEWTARNRPDLAAEWLLPVVGETWDGYLNSINEPFVTVDDAGRAIDAATSGPVAEGSAGGGTGMNCYGFKGGNGTASRLVEIGGRTYTVAVFLQANFGERGELTVQGVPLGDLDVPYPMGDMGWFLDDRRVPGGSGSCIGIVATDAPLIPDQCEALARRVPLGLARTGTAGGHFSGDIFLALSTGNAGALDNGFDATAVDDVELRTMRLVPWSWMDLLYTATVQAAEEAVLNALVANEDMTGRAGHFSPALPHDVVRERMAAFGRLRSAV
ncbi:DmpA family aminopeptidase [Demequina maris]|uniref:DmpA family aminopeptidase n=1 Tax=Demequina maris TaxID=1638982 RepID=UPI00078527D0|nr:P1 family peptidase [Demequina maris]